MVRAVSSRLPRLFETLRTYDTKTFARDCLAGVTVGLVALPLAMAFGISSGASPQSGIYTAIVAGFLISALGGSRVQIGGPTGAFVVVVSGIIAKHGLDGLYMCTLLAGIVLLIMGLTGLGAAVRFLPRMIQVAQALGTWSPEATALGVGALVFVLLVQRFAKGVPGAIIALVLGTLAVRFLHLNVETIGSRFGGIPSGLPPLHIPTFRPEFIMPLLPSVLTVAMLGAIESLMSATVADRMAGDHHDPNVELTAQGIANIAAPLVGGLPATGAIARTATNIRSGAKTPVAGIVHALTLLAVIAVAAPLAKDVPLSVLAGILLVVAYNMGEWHEIPDLLKLSKNDISVWLATFALTVFADLSVAVEVGMILAALLMIRKIAMTTTVIEETQAEVEAARVHLMQDKSVPDYVTVYRIHGPFLFGGLDKLGAITDRLSDLTPIVILRLRNMTALDGSGLGALEDLADALHATGRTLILCGAREQPAKLMDQAEFDEHVGHANVCADLDAALARARAVHAEPAAT